MMDGISLAIDRGDLRQTQVVRRPIAAGGGIVLAIDHFALTANNVTYAAFGERMNYWDFFPLDDRWGLVPVWGFGTVISSDVPAIGLGERFYGYFPMASHVRMEPGEINEQGFLDLADNRARLTAGYNQYLKVGADPAYDDVPEQAQMLFRPLFLTAYAIDAHLFEGGAAGPASVLLSSASSKTSHAAAFLLARRGGVRVVGLTSNRNLPYVARLGCYDDVVPYEAVEDLTGTGDVAYVDMAGNGMLRRRIHEHFGDRLKVSCAVGATNWDRMETAGVVLPGPKPTRFFVPGVIAAQVGKLGVDGFHAAYMAAWKDYIAHMLAPGAAWSIDRRHGVEEARSAWSSLVDGRDDPAVAHIVSISV